MSHAARALGASLLLMAVATGMAQGGPGKAGAVAPAAAAPRPTGFTPSTSFEAKAEEMTFGVDRDAESSTAPVVLDAGSYAYFQTSQGDFVARLLRDKAPKTVENFTGLASGTKDWKHPVTMLSTRKPLYNNTLIYKTVENALIYGGDPLNSGVGDPGYTIPMEAKGPDPERFDAAGVLAMDRSGANASGSRWLITLRTFPDWSDRYTIFGRVVAGIDVIRGIARRPTRRPTIPLDPAVVYSVQILEVPRGKRAVATYGMEDGRKVISVSKSLIDAPTPTPTPMITPVPSAKATTGTLAGKAAAKGPARPQPGKAAGDKGTTATKAPAPPAIPAPK